MAVGSTLASARRAPFRCTDRAAAAHSASAVLDIVRGVKRAAHCITCGAFLAPVMLDGRERMRCAACGWLWLDLPRAVVLVLAVAPSGRVVLTRDDRFPANKWG